MIGRNHRGWGLVICTVRAGLKTKQMFSFHTLHHNTSGCTAKHGPLAARPLGGGIEGEEKETYSDGGGLQCGRDGNNSVGGKLKGRVQEMTGEEIKMEKRMS